MITRNVNRVGAATLAVLLAASTSGEVHRFTEETLTLLMLESLNVAEVYAEPEEGASRSDAQPRAFSAERLVERLPQLATVAIADEGEGLPMTVRAVFAVDPEGDRPGGEIPLELGLLKIQGVYAVREKDRARLAAWLGARTAAFVAGDVVLDRIEGSDAPAEVRVGHTATNDQPHPWSAVGEPFSQNMEHLLGQTFRDISFTILNVSDEPADILLDWLEKNPSAMLHARRSAMGFLAGPEADARAGVPRPVYLVLDRAGAVREVMVGAMSRVGAEKADGSVDHLTELVERHL